jgi:hypothetical protein
MARSTAPLLPLRALAAGSLLAALALLLPACASVKFERTTETSGTFESRGMAFTLLSIDIPKSALNIARENAADANLPNMEVHEARVRPHLGGLDWLLDIIGVRRAHIRGTWGFDGEDR